MAVEQYRRRVLRTRYLWLKVGWSLSPMYIKHFTDLGRCRWFYAVRLRSPIPEDVVLLAGGYLVHRDITRYPLRRASLVEVVTVYSCRFSGRHFVLGLARIFLFAWLGRKQQYRAVSTGLHAAPWHC